MRSPYLPVLSQVLQAPGGAAAVLVSAILPRNVNREKLNFYKDSSEVLRDLPQENHGTERPQTSLELSKTVSGALSRAEQR